MPSWTSSSSSASSRWSRERELTWRDYYPARRCARGVDRQRHCRSGALTDPARPAPLLDATDDPQAVQLKG
jgi:hypothetical protein